MSDEVQVAGIKSSSEDRKFYPVKQLNGRAQIFTGEKVITRENVLSVLNDALKVHSRNRADIVYLEKYLRGVQPILDRVKNVNADINNRVVVNIANQIVAFKTANFAGDPIQYVSRGGGKTVQENVKELNSMMLTEGKPSKDMELAYTMFTCGVGYRLVQSDKAAEYANAKMNGDIFDEAPFEFYVPDTRNTFVVRVNDVTKRVIMGVTYVFKNESTVEYTVYTDKEAYKITGTQMSVGDITSVEVHNLGFVPLIEYPCNPSYMGAFEVVLPLLDAYNLLTSNRLDGIEQFIQALMVFEGVDVTREQFLELRDLGAIKLPPSVDGRSSRVYYLNSQLDQQQTQTLIDNIYDRILQIVGMPSQGNANTSDSSNNGAMIVKNGWWNAEARALETENSWKLSETDFLRVVLKICRDSNAINTLKVSDVEPKFGRRSYEDKLTKTQSFTTLIAANVPPIQAYKYSGLDTDPEAAAIMFEDYQKKLEDELGFPPPLANSGISATINEEKSRSIEEKQERDETDEEKRRRRMADRDGIVGEK